MVLGLRKMNTPVTFSAKELDRSLTNGLLSSLSSKKLFVLLLNNIARYTKDHVSVLFKHGLKLSHKKFLDECNFEKFGKLFSLMIELDNVELLYHLSIHGLFQEIRTVYRVLCALRGKKDLQEIFIRFMNVHDLWTADVVGTIVMVFNTREFSTILDHVVTLHDRFPSAFNMGSSTMSTLISYSKLILKVYDDLAANTDIIIHGIVDHIDPESLSEIIGLLSRENVLVSFLKYFNIYVSYTGTHYVTDIIYDPVSAPSCDMHHSLIELIKVMVLNGFYDISFNEFLKWDLEFCENNLCEGMLGIDPGLDGLIIGRFKGPYKKLLSGLQGKFCDVIINCLEDMQ